MLAVNERPQEILETVEDPQSIPIGSYVRSVRTLSTRQIVDDRLDIFFGDWGLVGFAHLVDFCLPHLALQWWLIENHIGGMGIQAIVVDGVRVGPSGNMRSPNGNSRLTDLKEASGSAATGERPVKRIVTAASTTRRRWLVNMETTFIPPKC